MTSDEDFDDSLLDDEALLKYFRIQKLELLRLERHLREFGL